MAAPSPELLADVQRLRAGLLDIADRARTLSWNAERPWTPPTHVWGEKGSPVVDLHDLSVKLGVACVDAVLEQADALKSGAVIWVIGRGSHSLGGKSPLRAAVQDRLLEAAEERGWRLRAGAPGRLVLVLDEGKATAAAGGRLGLVAWGAILLFVASLAWALWQAVAG